ARSVSFVSRQRLNSLESNCPKRVFAGSFGERFNDGIAATRAKFYRRPDSTHRVSVVRHLISKFLVAPIELQAFDQVIAAVEVDDQRFRIDVESKLFFGLIDEYSMRFLTCRSCDGDVYGGDEEIRRREPWTLVVGFLSLFDRELKRFRAVVGRGDLKLGMAHLVDPLVEKPSEILHGGFFDRD